MIDRRGVYGHNGERGIVIVEQAGSEPILDALEQRLEGIAGAIAAFRGGADDDVALDTVANGDEPGELAPEESDLSGLNPGESVFEFVLERIVQGLHSHLGGSDPEQFDRVVRSAPDIVCTLDGDARVVSVNDQFFEQLGYPPEQVVGSRFFEFVSDGFEHKLAARVRGLSGSPEHEVSRPDDILVLRARRENGTNASFECVTIPASRGSDPALVVVLRDMSLHRSLVDQLRESKDNYDALSETLTEAIIRIDESFRIVFANSAVRSTFGYAADELRGRPFSILFPDAMYARHEAEFRKYFFVDDQDRRMIGMRNTVELLGKHKNRGVTPMEMSFGNAKDYRGRTLTCIIRDITQRKNAERRLRRLAYHDQLTGLGNRDLFDIEIRKVLERPEALAGGMAALLFLDLDGFKQINDTMGHDAGDQLLIDTGARLSRTLRESDSVYRFGGDEFVVLLGYIHQRRDAAVVANKILGEIRRPFELSSATEGGRNTATVGVSIGIALIPVDGSTIEAVTKAADLAMYHAKESGKNRFSYYRVDLNDRAVERWELEQGIRSALENGEFDLHYQPIVDSDGAIRGLEALLRWNHRTKGTIAPSRFIPVAEETGIIVPLGNWVLETACRDIRRWNDSGHPDVYVSVNLSPRQFDQRDLVETVGGAFERTGADPANVRLEITESCIMSAPEEAIERMHTLKARHPGLSIAIDDFGTGYSSLSYLSQLPASTIKIDLSFVTNLFTVNNQKIVRAIINLAHSLGVDIVAEGVESADQWGYFREHRCRYLQGYFFSAAVDRDAATDLLLRGHLAQPS